MKNQPLQKQIKYIEEVLLKNPSIKKILELTPQLKLSNWYLGAGCIAQTIWNYQHGFDLNNGIKDYDLVYYDEDVSYEAEDKYIKKGKELFKDIEVEIRNQARVHLWYKKKFRIRISQYKSVEEAINTWPTTSTSIGIRYDKRNQFQIYAPYGLNDLLKMIVRPNKTLIRDDYIYLDKAIRYKKVWPQIRIIDWNE